LDDLKSELETLTGIPEASQILMTQEGLELKAEILNEAIRVSGRDEYVIFQFNRDSLDPSNSGDINSASSLIENITLEPQVIVPSPKQNTRVRLSISDELGAYANMFQMHHSQGQSFLKTAITHSEICERLYEEQKAQLEALDVALLNLKKHCCSVVDHHNSFHKFAEKEVTKYEIFIQSFPANMEILKRITIDPKIQSDNDNSVIKNKESCVLADFILEDKLMALASKGIEAIGRLSREVNELNIEVQSVQQGTDALRKKTFNSELTNMETILERNKACCDVIRQHARNLEKGLTRVQGQVAKLVQSKGNVDFEKPIEAMENLANYQLKEYFPEIKKLDDYIREQAIYFVKSKNATTSTLISNLQQISRLESIIASIPGKLSRLDEEVQAMAQDYKLLAHLLLAKSQQLAEVMAHFRDLEQKRRDKYRLNVKKYIPVKIPDNSPPMCEISAVNMNDDQLPSFSKEDIQCSVVFYNDLSLLEFNETVMSHASLVRPTFSLSTSKVRIQQSSNIDPLSTLQSNLVKLFGQIEGMNMEFENIVEKSSLFEKPATDNANIMSRLRFINDGRLLSSKSVFPSPKGSRRSRQSFSEDSVATIGTDLLVEKMKQLDVAEEKVKAYEARIKNLENLLQTNFKASKGSVVATTSKPGISNPESLTMEKESLEPLRHNSSAEPREKKFEKLPDSKTDFQNLSNKYNEAIRELEILKNRNSELDFQYKVLANSHEKVLRENEILEKKVLDLEKNHQSVQSSYSEVVDKNASLESRLKELETLYSHSSNELSDMGRRHNELQIEHDSLSAQCGELEVIVTKLQNLNKELELSNTSASTLENRQTEELKSFKQRLQDAELECEKKVLELNSLRSEHDNNKKLVEDYALRIEQAMQEKDKIIKEYDDKKKMMHQEVEGWKETLDKMNTAREELQIALDKSRDRVKHVELENLETMKALEKTEDIVKNATEITLECMPIVMKYISLDSEKEELNTELSLIKMVRRINDVTKYLDAELIKTRESLENSTSEGSSLRSVLAGLRQELQERTEFSRSLSRELWNYYHNIRTMMGDREFAIPVKSESRPIIKPSTVGEDKDGQIKSPEQSLSDSYHAEDLGKFFASDYVDDLGWPRDRYETLIILTSKVNLEEVRSMIRKTSADAEALYK
ncbi:7756_t:CDS:10, partial [Acaulospora colombiana]